MNRDCAAPSTPTGEETLSVIPFAEDAGQAQAIPTAVLYSISLDGGEAHSLTIHTPFVSLYPCIRLGQGGSAGLRYKIGRCGGLLA